MNQTLADILIQEFNADPAAVETAAAAARQKGADPGVVFLEKKLVDEPTLQKARSLLFDLPFVPDLPLSHVDVGLARKLPAGWLKRHLVLPFLPGDGAEGEEPEAVLAVHDPSRFQVYDPVIHLMKTRRIQVVVSLEASILSGIHLSYDVSPDSAQRLVRDMEEGEGGARKKIEDFADLLDDVSDAPVIKLVNHLISRSVKAGASDIHIEPFRDSFKIRYRVDGILYDMIDPPKWIQASLVSRIKVMADLNIAEKRLPQDGRMAVKVGDQLIDVRLSTVPTGFGERVVMRLLNKSMDLLDLSELGLSTGDLDSLKHLLELPNGILLVTGPTGSGKTTTLYAALSRLNTADRNIITIEDPVEYQIRGISQIQVNPKIGLTFASGLRSIVRQDPDVILVGEIRDRETADIAVQSALTGHLVFSTLHTTDAASAMIRLVDIGGGAVSHLLVRGGGGGPAPGAQTVPGLQKRGPARPGGFGQLGACGGRGKGPRLVRGRGVRHLPVHRIPGPHRDFRDHARDRRRAKGGAGKPGCRRDPAGGGRLGHEDFAGPRERKGDGRGDLHGRGLAGDPVTAQMISMKQAVMALAAGWERTPPSRRQMEAGADRLEDLRKSGAPPLWERPPGFLTFTLDDMLGQGITLINKLGAACGMTVRFLGLTQTREKVIEAVLETKPQLLGCTVLQLDTGEDIRFIRDRVPPHIPITAGGPLFKADPSLAREWGIDYPCSTAADFLKILPEIQGG